MTRITNAVAILALLVLTPSAMATSEQARDAGDLPATAQDLSDQAVQRIDGAFADPLDVDMYRLCLTGGGTFSASTVGGSAADTQLFLFDAGGLGVYGNDDADGGSQSRLPAGHALTPQAAGVYYLAVSPYHQEPRSDSGSIFSGKQGVLGPTERGALGPVIAWSGRTSAGGAYRIELTGADCTPPDTTAPSIDIRSPLDGGVHLLHELVASDYGCADEQGGTGLVSCQGTVRDGAAIDTGAVGEHRFSVEAADAAGNTSFAHAAYRVVYDFEGFFWPVKGRGRDHRWKAGAAIPIRFELSGDQGLDVIEDGWPQVAEVECGAGAEPAGGELARHPRWFRELAFRSRKERYVMVWKTDREWAGSCRQFMLRLGDGTVKRAEFRFEPRRGHNPL